MRKIITVLFVVAGARELSGKSLDRLRFEVGPLIGSTTFGTAISTRDMRTAYGGRVVLNLQPRIAIEYQMAYIPGESYNYNSAKQGSGHFKWKFWQVKRGILNAFGVVGPGFMREEYEYRGGAYHYLQKYRSMAIDYGVGIEVVPHRRWSVRLDLTDFYAGQKYAGTYSLLDSTSSVPAGSPRFWHHHLDFKAGVMFRF